MLKLQSGTIVGKVKVGDKTKHLISVLKKGDIAVINHENIDELAAHSLYKAGVKAVVNLQDSMTGDFFNRGPELLLAKKIPLIDLVNKAFVEKLNSNEKITIDQNKIYQNGNLIGTGRRFSSTIKYQLEQIASSNVMACLTRFIDNTLHFVDKEQELIFDNLYLDHLPYEISQLILDRHCLIVVRGSQYWDDIRALTDYIKLEKPILIGVDGGADALIDHGFIPDIVFGDMDSITDRALIKTKYRLVHGYLNGVSPGAVGLWQKNIDFHIIKATGTSEDVALRLVHQLKAKTIVTVGTHTHMQDFLEKGRSGMSSTFLTRLLVGDKLIDMKGINNLHNNKVNLTSIFILLLVAIMPILILASVSPVVTHFIRLLYWNFRFAVC